LVSTLAPFVAIKCWINAAWAEIAVARTAIRISAILELFRMFLVTFCLVYLFVRVVQMTNIPASEYCRLERI
jgi:hypothetical protein